VGSAGGWLLLQRRCLQDGCLHPRVLWHISAPFLSHSTTLGLGVWCGVVWQRAGGLRVANRVYVSCGWHLRHTHACRSTRGQGYHACTEEGRRLWFCTCVTCTYARRAFSTLSILHFLLHGWLAVTWLLLFVYSKSVAHYNVIMFSCWRRAAFGMCCCSPRRRGRGRMVAYQRGKQPRNTPAARTLAFGEGIAGGCRRRSGGAAHVWAANNALACGPPLLPHTCYSPFGRLCLTTAGGRVWRQRGLTCGQAAVLYATPPATSLLSPLFYWFLLSIPLPPVQPNSPGIHLL